MATDAHHVLHIHSDGIRTDVVMMVVPANTPLHTYHRTGSSSNGISTCTLSGHDIHSADGIHAHEDIHSHTY